MSWAMGLSLWIVGGIAAMWIFAEIIERFERTDGHEHDWLAERKRKIAQRGHKTRAGLR